MLKNSLILLIGFVALSCKSTKTHYQSAEKQIVIQKDTLFVERIRSTNDTIYVQVPAVETANKECDTLCQRQLQAVLQQMQFHRKSAESKVGFYFDKYKNQLVLYQQLQEQLNMYKSINQQDSNIQIKEVIKEIKKPYVPLWVKSLAFIGAFAMILLIGYLVVLGKKIIL